MLGGSETAVKGSTLAIVVLVMALPADDFAQEPIDWAQAEKNIVRIDPSEITELPPAVRAELTRRNCTVPQPYGSRSTSNVVSGRFTSSNQTDVAVLCSRDSVSSILVFRGGSSDTVDELASSPDRAYLQGMMPGEAGFSRRISVAVRESINPYAEAFDAEVPPTLEHDGIEDAFLEKASSILYWYETRWLTLQGGD
jgi:hypothetical protein